jgi:transcriptional regulator with XRE-family HTH domain
MSIGENIKRLAEEKGMTLKQVAEAANMSVGTLYAINARSSRFVRVETQIKIAAALGVPLHALWVDEPESAATTKLNFTAASRRFYFERQLLKHGIRVRGDEEGNMWIEYPDGTIEAGEEDIIRLYNRLDRDLMNIMNDFKEEHAAQFRPHSEEDETP